MSIRPILRMGNPMLNAVSEAVPADWFNTKQLDDLVADMWATMMDASGAGIAAIQIGVPRRVMIFGTGKMNPRYPDAEIVPVTVLVNPVVEVTDWTPVESFEGCLSVPGIRGPVVRPTAVRYRGFTPQGEAIDRSVGGFHARVVQHEFDHLEGRLFPSRVTDHSRFGFIPELEAGGVIKPLPASPTPKSKL